jgi:calpain-15
MYKGSSKNQSYSPQYPIYSLEEIRSPSPLSQNRFHVEKTTKLPETHYLVRPYDNGDQDYQDDCEEETHFDNMEAGPFSSYSKYMDLIRKLANSKTKYRDKAFPANSRSLCGGNQEMELLLKDATWLSPDQFWGRDYEIFEEKIEPDDIIQGQLGDCYFLSGASCMALKPQKIAMLFSWNKSYGIFCVKICYMGEWKFVVVDDLFPCKNNKPIFATGNGHELWVLILEKVWAKIFGSYASIIGGNPTECFHALTGAPTKTIFIKDMDPLVLWNKLLEGSKEKFEMACGSLFDNIMSPSLQQLTGIFDKHAYSILAAKEVFYQNQYVKLLKIRNPHGKVEWRGPWSDYWKGWTPDLRKKLEHEEKDDGVFFIPFEYFLKYFCTVFFCYTHDNSQLVSCRDGSYCNETKSFFMEIRSEGEYFLTVNQESRRKYYPDKSFQYSTVSLILSQTFQNQIQWIEETGKDQEVWMKVRLDPGKYDVDVKVDWTSRMRNEFVLSLYGPTMKKL